MSEQIIDVPLSRLQPSPTNPRRHVNHERLAELAKQFEQLGVLEPLLARPTGKGEQLEVVFGHRRLAAAKIAKLATVPVMVRKMSDDDALEAQIVENVQREDVHPLDEADGYAELVKRGYDLSKIAERVGRPGTYIAQRLQLCELQKPARQAFDAGRLTLAVALLLARVPPKLQNAALREVAGDEYRECMRASEAARRIQQNFMLRLADAPFDRTDPALVKSAGTCVKCRKRTGAQAELFADVKSPDLCTDPGCYRDKLDAWWHDHAAAATRAGTRVVSDAEVSKGVDWYGGGKWVSLTEKVYLGAREHPLKALLGGKLKVAIGRDKKTGRPLELVERAAAKPIVAKQDKRTSPSSRPSGSSRAEKKKLVEIAAGVRLALGQVADVAGKAKPDVLLELLAAGIIVGAAYETKKLVGLRRGLQVKNASTADWNLLDRTAAKMKARDRAVLALELVAAESAPQKYRLQGDPLWRTVLERCRVSWAKCIGQVRRIAGKATPKPRRKGKKSGRRA